jgi:hypothetical protein
MLRMTKMIFAVVHEALILPPMLVQGKPFPAVHSELLNHETTKKATQAPLP